LSNSTAGAFMHIPIMNDSMVAGCATISERAASHYTDVVSIRVQTDRLDNIYHGTVAFIKIDVEGHEMSVLEGAQGIIDRCRPRVLIEVDNNLSPNGLAAVSAFFDRWGYRGYYIFGYQMHPIEMFSVREYQDNSKGPDLNSTLKERPKDLAYISNFLFMPPDETRETFDNIRRRLLALSPI
jgi:hypothetical protein